MDLIERLCQVDPDEPNGEPQERHIALNPFCEGLFSILGGYHTVAQLKSFYAMTAEDIVEMDVLVARILDYSATSNTNDRERAVHRVRGILCFWEQSGGLGPGDPGYIPGYSTVADIRSKFGEV